MKVFTFDASICNGCYNCQIACKDEHCSNDWMPYAKPQPETGQFWIGIRETVRGSVPRVRVSGIHTGRVGTTRLRRVTVPTHGGRP